jgi:hypothetical protein
MATGHGRGGPSQSAFNHPALASASASSPCPRRGAISGRPSIKKQSNRFNLHLKFMQRGN